MSVYQLFLIACLSFAMTWLFALQYFLPKVWGMKPSVWRRKP
jgi:hypothetical protein